MSRFKTKQAFIEDIEKEWELLTNLLEDIPKKSKTEVVIDGMSIKDFLAHRAEWGRMMIQWYKTAKSGETPAVPTEKYKWNQLKELNADIFKRFKNTSLRKIESDLKEVHDELYKIVKKATDKELFEKNVYSFTGASDLATYLNSSTAAHYRSARRHIQKWWRSKQEK